MCMTISNESDVPKLPYLRAIIKETLRLHTLAPLILQECREDCLVKGYLVRAGTRVLINASSIMRDPGEWKDPDKFIPERFLEGSPDPEDILEHQKKFKGQNFRYVPFWSGGAMVMLVMHAAIGSLIQCFDWKVKGGRPPRVLPRRTCRSVGGL